MSPVAILLIALIAVVVVVALYFAGKQNNEAEGILDRFSVGTYLAGFAGTKDREAGRLLGHRGILHLYRRS